MNKKIIFDVMNSDNGEICAIQAANKFAKEFPNYTLVLVGNQETINNNIDKRLKNLEVVNSSKVVKKATANIRELLREESSMLTSFEELNKGADAILSSGDSGAFTIISSLKIKRLDGIERPAFMPIIPSANPEKNFLLLDAGANVEIKSTNIVEWAELANVVFKNLFSKNDFVKVGILNIGTENYKGISAIKEANELIISAKNLDYEYLGFVEPNNVINGESDVVLADGYAGNIFLKTYESATKSMASIFKKAFMKNLKTKIGALLLRKELNKIKTRYDYRNIGGAFIIGLEKIIVKAHGSSDEVAFYGALNQIRFGLENNLIDKIKEKLNNLKKEDE
ncbi:phosphate acyltransferase PlsX [Metamycoplasma hyosynoviae]|uniref:phosphate acyltransferase PlsX n=1 Tax=Metamycoplasma hyosynoviae TaxID=29559 RepID=UPI002359B81F|nr:phosphate acyltransferase PlsX [Metamycoplasma hyosynoviae]MDC8937199.1 phosphate acyltransferase PlsX [Metamycoplasma hyosynoviae]MDD7897178.1 phosphate acyltransferase PlsX [Metamycoplasma hyosynoviae]